MAFKNTLNVANGDKNNIFKRNLPTETQFQDNIGFKMKSSNLSIFDVLYEPKFKK